jgi:thiosulfate dehydrogenase
MKKLILGLIIGFVFLPVMALLYVWLGFAPVATSAPPLPLERTITGMALHARIAKEAPKESPVPPSEANLLAGAMIYHQNCAVCHGIAGEPETAIAKGMFPPPPQLFRGKGVTDDPVGETFWKVSNGIRLTGMPGFGGSLTAEQAWKVSQLLATADKLPPSVKDALARPAPAH